MKVTFIKHSCFSVELEKHVLLFDYYGEGKLPEWNKDKMIYVLNSHKHADHFQLQIFSLRDIYPNIHFFLGSDIRLSEKYLERNHIQINQEQELTRLKKRTELQYDKDLYIRTLKSTDIGVAFVVKCEDKFIYHAGDLNWWHWEGGEKEVNKQQEKCYKEEIESIRNIKFDVSFVPLDGRLENAYYYGMEFFLKTIDTPVVFPMHMWEDYSVIKRYKEEKHVGYEKMITLSEEGQVFISSECQQS